MLYFLKSFKQYEPSFSISCLVEEKKHIVSFQYKVIGNIKHLEVCNGSSTGGYRKFGLWNSTCFEAFLGHSTGYWEFNFALTKDWNIYFFSSYRQGLLWANFFPFVEIQSIFTKYSIECRASVDFSYFKKALKINHLQLGLSVVLKTQDEMQYWALKHPQREPDFHDKNAFIGNIFFL